MASDLPRLPDLPHWVFWRDDLLQRSDERGTCWNGNIQQHDTRLLDTDLCASLDILEHGTDVGLRNFFRSFTFRIGLDDACLVGWGLSKVISYQISPFIEAERLQTVLDEFELPPMPIHVVHREGRMVSGKVRALVDFMVEHLRTDILRSNSLVSSGRMALVKVQSISRPARCSDHFGCSSQ